MRASKTNAKCKMQNAKFNEEHISGAEGIYRESEITEKSREYINRALSHPRGMPDRVIITLDKVKEKPIKVPILPVNTLKCSSPDKAKEIIIQKLGSLGVSKKAIDNGLKILEAKKTMRGAALMLMESGRRKEPDRERGVRVSRLGIEKSVEKKLSRRLALKGINTITVKEALILASKVASCPDIVAEVCISDDPDYTTGYIASKGLGYLRIPNIKKCGEMHGGRVLFIGEDADIGNLIEYLEQVPVLVY